MAEKLEEKFDRLLKEMKGSLCDVLAHDIYEHAQGRLPAEDVTMVEDHLAHCDQCRRVFDEFVEVLARPAEQDALSRLRLSVRKIWDSLNGFLTDNFFGDFWALRPEGARGPEIVRRFFPGERGEFRLDIDRPSHLVVLRHDPQREIYLAYPREDSDRTGVNRGQTFRLQFQAHGPVGEHLFRCVLVAEGSGLAPAISFASPEETSRTVEAFISALGGLDRALVDVAELGYEVVEPESC